jgi:hypothetical protein
MITKPAVYKECETCGKKTLVEEEKICCDTCKKEIDQKKSVVLDCTAFWHHGPKDTERFIFCSWICFFKKMRNYKTDYFISFPSLHFDEHEKQQGVRAKDFWKWIKTEKEVKSQRKIK